MKPDPSTEGTAVHLFEAINYVTVGCLPRDAEQSRRLHEPESRITTIDPMTGHDITNIERRPYHIDGNVTMYFETEQTRQAYLDMPIDHPFPLVDNPYEDGEAEG